MEIPGGNARHFEICNLNFAFCIEGLPIFQMAKLIQKGYLDPGLDRSTKKSLGFRGVTPCGIIDE